MPRLVLLGPQKLEPTVGPTLAELGIREPLALVTAGWQENEDDDANLRRDLGLPAVNLALYHRAERVFERDPELLIAYRERQRRLQQLQRLYRRRLDHTLDAYRELLAVDGIDDLVLAEREAALEAVRDLDLHHLERVRQVHAEMNAGFGPERPAVAEEREEIESLLAASGPLLIAGGHVAVLLNRLRLFGVDKLVTKHTVIAWSAGAMVLSSQIVLFHDSPPWGAGNSEVLDLGLGVCPDLLPLPWASHRLRLSDPARVGLLARRYSPLRCIALDDGSRLERRGDRGEDRCFGHGVGVLEIDGTVRRIGAETWQEVA